MRYSPTRKALLRDIRLRQWKAQFKQWLKLAVVSSWNAILSSARWLWNVIGVKAQDTYIVALVSKRHDELYRLGERCYELYRRGSLMHDDLLAHLRRIEMLDAQISVWEIERRRLLPTDKESSRHNSQDE
ncbi:MAG: hypothetical protein GDYSWBUE_000781 [Candidatus Fervidibacterota bacterium]